MEFLLDEAQLEYINEISGKYGISKKVLTEVFGKGFIDGENTKKLKDENNSIDSVKISINIENVKTAKELVDELIKQIKEKSGGQVFIK